MWCIKKGDFVAVGFLRYRGKYSENDKENNKNFGSVSNCKFWMPPSIFINEVSF